jgi:CubicO group peptidase (beta-lactamase class C family)
VAVAEATRSEIERIVAEEQARHPVPGVSLGIASGDETILAQFGVTNVDHPLPVDADTIFQIGSITKTFLGTLVMRLVEDGVLDLDVPVRRWLPDLRLRDSDAAARATLRHLLTHTAGWFGDHFVDVGWNDDALARYVASMADLEQQVPLGTEWAYNNAAFGLAGRVVEVAAGEPIEYVMRHRLFVPLGLQRTFLFANSVITYRVAAGHNVFDGQAQVVRPWALPRASNCVGGIASTVPDMLRYARFHMGDGTAADGSRYLSPASMELMRSPLVSGPLGQHRGIAWSVEDVGNVTIIGHGGATFGQQALLWIAPAKRFALAMLTNSSQATQLQNAITTWSWDRYLGVRRETPKPRPHGADEAERVAGTYRNPSNELRIAVDGAALMLHQRPLESSFRKLMRNPPPVPEPVELAFNSAGRLVLLGGPLKDTQIELLGPRASGASAGSEQAPEWVRFGSRLYKKERA